MKTDVDEDQIEPYMAEINRQFEYIDKEDIIKIGRASCRERV